MKKIFILIFILLSFPFVSYAMILPPMIIQPAITAEEEEGGDSATILQELLDYAGSDPAYISSRLANTDLDVSDAVTYMESDTHSDSLVVDALEEADITADRVQEILYEVNLEKNIDFITDGTGDIEYTSNTSISGVNIFNEIDVSSEVTLTITGQPGIIIADTITNNGTINKSATGGAGGNIMWGAFSAGGTGGGQLILISKTFDNNNDIKANGGAGQNGTTGNPSSEATMPGDDGENANCYRINSDTVGDGGNGGYELRGIGYYAGGGGGTQSGNYGGDGGDVSYTTYDTSEDLFINQKEALVDYWLENVLLKTPTSTESFLDGGGAGGGEGGNRNTSGSGGGGGGGGGHILNLCVDYDNTGTISANGANGGNGVGTGPVDAAGGGGGGGLNYGFYSILTSEGTISANGGNTGTSNDSYTGENGTAGTAAIYDIGDF